jgi:hypothetical protein
MALEPLCEYEYDVDMIQYAASVFKYIRILYPTALEVRIEEVR